MAGTIVGRTETFVGTSGKKIIVDYSGLNQAQQAAVQPYLEKLYSDPAYTTPLLNNVVDYNVSFAALALGTYGQTNIVGYVGYTKLNSSLFDPVPTNPTNPLPGYAGPFMVARGGTPEGVGDVALHEGDHIALLNLDSDSTGQGHTNETGDFLWRYTAITQAIAEFGAYNGTVELSNLNQDFATVGVIQQGATIEYNQAKSAYNADPTVANQQALVDANASKNAYTNILNVFSALRSSLLNPDGSVKTMAQTDAVNLQTQAKTVIDTNLYVRKELGYQAQQEISQHKYDTAPDPGAPTVYGSDLSIVAGPFEQQTAAQSGQNPTTAYDNIGDSLSVDNSGNVSVLRTATDALGTTVILAAFTVDATTGQVTSSLPGYAGKVFADLTAFSLYANLYTSGVDLSGLTGTIASSTLALFSQQNIAVAPASNIQVNDSLLTATVQQLNLIGQTAPSDGGATGSVVNNQIAGSGGAGVFMPGQGVSNNVADTWSTSIGTGYTQPGWQRILSSTSDLTLQTGILNDLNILSRPNDAALASGLLINDTATNGLSVVNVDPLLIDLSGAGINVSNWIGNTVYFDTGVKNDGSGQADGLQHHTSWAASGTGILALDLNGDGKIDDITETISEFFKGGPTPGHYADGLAALAALAQAGATVFSAATSLIDPATQKSYWSELVVWNDANQNGVTDAGELRTLGQLGITSINLVGSGNSGEAINGSSVTNRTTYTRSDGSSGQVAAVNFQTDVAGDITTTASGGALISSLTEGGPTQTTTFVAQNTTAHSYSIVNGKLTDVTSGTVIAASGITAVLSSSQNDVISVASTDTGTYWLGGGTGADTLTGGGGTNVFLVNPTTVVHGGTGTGSFNIAKVIGNQGVNIDLAKDNLQEVIGGPGGSVFNASGTTWNVFIQATSGNNIIIGGAATDALSGGTGDDLIEAGPGGSVIHAGQGNDVIYGGSGATAATQPSYVNAGASSNAAYVERLFNGALGKEADLTSFTADVAGLNNGSMTQTSLAIAILNSAAGQAIYAGMNNTQFTNAIFQGLLGRAPSSTDLNSFVSALNGGQTRGVALQTVATNALSQTYWGGKHPGASDVIFAGPGNDTIVLGTNNSEVYDGTGTLSVIGSANGFSVVGFHGSYADYSVAHNSDGSITVTNINNMDGDGTVTMKNVTALDFKDISQVRFADALGMPATDYLYTADTSKVTTNGSGQYVIAAATLLANDIDYAGKTLSIRELVDNNGNPIALGSSGQVNGGTAALSTDGATITFTPTANFTGVMSFRYHVKDSSGSNGALVQQVGTANTAEMTATAYLNTPNQPTDSLLDSEWFLQSTNVLSVWRDGYTGAGVSVGVFDPSGNVDFSNPDLAVNAGQSYRVDGTPGTEQLGTHATLVAGVIGAAHNGLGAVGVAPDAKIGSEALGSGASADITNIFHWDAYDVVNNSWGNSALFHDNGIDLPAFNQAFATAATTGRYNSQVGVALGTVIVFAGGNNRQGGDNTNYHNESNSRYAITVGGINAPSDLGSLQISGAPFSNPGSSILVSAPANNVSSTSITYTNDFGQQFGADYQTAQGTSFATPIVSGVAALMLQANPTLGYRDVQKILAYSARKVDPTGSNWTVNGATDWNGGGLHTSEDYGFGEIDAHAAVRLAESWDRTNAAGNEQSNVISSGTTAAHPTTPSLGFTIPIDQGVSATKGIDFNISNSGTPLWVEHADVELNLVGVNPNNLIVKLIAPSGVVSTLLYQPSAALNPSNWTGSTQNVHFTFDSVRDYGEIATGNWKLEVAYASGTTPQGTVAGASLNLYGSTDDDKVFIFTDEFASLGSSAVTLNHNPAADFTDTLNAAATTGNNTYDIRSGSTSTVIDGRSVSIATNTVIDYLYTGDGNDTIRGNDHGDTIWAGRGINVVTGGAGNDVIYAHDGSDTINGGAGTDLVTYERAQAAINGNLATGVVTSGSDVDHLSNVEQLGGTPYDDTLIGSANADTLIGLAGNDYLDGGLGADTLIGGIGDDTYVVDNANDFVFENANEGIDTVKTVLAGYTLAANVENLIGTATTGQALAGNTLNNTISAGAGSTLTGGGGYDTYDYASNGGAQTINNGVVSDTAAQGELDLGVDLNPTNLWFQKVGSNLQIAVLGTSNRITVSGWFAHTYNQLGYLVLPDGSKIGAAAVTALANAMTAYASGNPSFNPQAAGQTMPGDATLLTALNTDWSRTITGKSGNDVVHGGYGNNTLIGGGGTDTIDGGAGASTVVFRGPRSEYLIRSYFVNGVLNATVTDHGSAGDGTAQLTNVTNLKFSDETITTPLPSANRLSNFDGRPYDDVLFQSQYNGALPYVALNFDGPNGIGTALGPLGSLSGVVYVGGTGDINGDGIADVVVQDTSDRTIYAVEQHLAGDPSITTVGSFDGFYVTGVGDINGDGYADIVLQSPTDGVIAYLDMAHGEVSAEVNVGVDAGWNVIGVGDFTGRGYNDILLENMTTGELDYADMTDGTLQGVDQITTLASGARVAAVADFNGDGHADILLYNGVGAALQYIDMSGGADSGLVTALPGEYMTSDRVVKGAAYIDNSGYPDILLQSVSTGATYWAGENSSGWTGASGTVTDQTVPAYQVVQTPTDGLVMAALGHDTLVAPQPDSTLIGDGRYDTYKYNAGTLNMRIVNSNANGSTATGELDFGPGITDQNLWFAQSGDNLMITVMDGQPLDQITVVNWFANDASKLSEVKDSSGLKLDGGLNLLIQSMAAYSSSHAGFNPAGLSQAPIDFQPTIAANWH